MAMFERNYRASASAELERYLRNIEEKDKVAQLKMEEFQEGMSAFQSNLNFAERLTLVSSVQAAEMRRRATEATLAYERMQKMETRDDLVDSFENPRERTARYQSMDKYNAEIAERRKQNGAGNKHETETPVVKIQQQEEHERRF